MGLKSLGFSSFPSSTRRVVCAPQSDPRHSENVFHAVHVRNLLGIHVAYCVLADNNYNYLTPSCFVRWLISMTFGVEALQ